MSALGRTPRTIGLHPKGVNGYPALPPQVEGIKGGVRDAYGTPRWIRKPSTRAR